MAEFWKSTPSYWCKFCSTYVKDTPIERKNHEASFKHQNSIQRGLRELHKNKERESRNQQRAKDEIARVNGLVDGTQSSGSKSGAILGLQDKGRAGVSTGPKLNSAAQRKLHAEQLLALGVELPEDLKREVQGISSWEVVSERVIEPGHNGEGSLADIVKKEQDSRLNNASSSNKGFHKRKAPNADDEGDGDAENQSAGWGSKLKHYPGQNTSERAEDLDALLDAVSTKKPVVKAEQNGKTEKEQGADSATAISRDANPGVDVPAQAIKRENGESEPPTVVFKKRKTKK